MTVSDRHRQAVAAELRQLDALLEAREYQEIQRRLNRLVATDSDKIAWLEEKEADEHVYLLYELSARLYTRDLARSIKLYARALLRRALDIAICQPGGAILGRLDDLVDDVRNAAIENPALFTRAIEEAMSQQALLRPRPWPNQLCLSSRPPDVPIPEDEQRRRRIEALEDMRIEAKSIELFAKAVELGEKRAYRVIESAIVVRQSFSDYAAWVDDNNLVLIGAVLSPGHRWGEASPRLIHWHAVTRVARPISPPGYVAGEVCVDEGELIAKLFKGVATFGSVAQFEGNFLLQGRFPDLELMPDPSKPTAFSSKRHFGCTGPPPLPEGIARDMSWWLKRGHGLLVFDHSQSGPWEEKTSLRTVDGTEIVLPITHRYAGYVLVYAPWKNAYLLRGTWRNPRTGVTEPLRRRGDDALLFWLSPNGQIEEVLIPYGMWDQGTPPNPYTPTRRGLITVGRRAEREDLPGFSGLFLFESRETPVRLLAGAVEIVAVSPNGCRIAATQRSQKALRGTETVRIIDVCRGEFQ